MAEEINLTDQYAVLLQQTVDESRSLREIISKGDKDSAKKIQDLSERVESLTKMISENSSTRNGKLAGKRASTSQVPKECRTDCRNMYATLLKEDEEFMGYDLGVRFDAKQNRLVTKQIIASVQNDQGGEGKCAWSPSQIRGACAVYLKTLKDSKRRKTKGGLDHNTICRRQGRLREKMAKRTWALDRIDMSDKNKQSVKSCLVKEFTSSDESDTEEMEDGRVKKGFFVKKLPWESDRLTEIKNILDKLYLKENGGVAQIKRYPHPDMSIRDLPDNAPKWAVKQKSDAGVSNTSVGLKKPLASSTPKQQSVGKQQSVRQPLKECVRNKKKSLVKSVSKVSSRKSLF